MYHVQEVNQDQKYPKIDASVVQDAINSYGLFALFNNNLLAPLVRFRCADSGGLHRRAIIYLPKGRAGATQAGLFAPAPVFSSPRAPGGRVVYPSAPHIQSGRQPHE
jgi:hypothetical protein